MKALISILAVHNYDNTVFDDMQLPEGVDRDTVINKIMIDNAELSLVYPEPSTLKMLIANWSRVNLNAWTRIAAALDAEYSPIENYDRYEEWTDSGTSSSLESTEQRTQQSTGTTRKVAGWNNDSTLTPAEGVDSSGTGSSTGSTNGTGSTTGKHSGHLHGNIGVTTAQEMITAEMELRSKFTLPEIISRSFRRNFCLMVY